MSFEMPNIPERTSEEVFAAKQAVAENAYGTAWAYWSEAAYHPEGSDQRKLFEQYALGYERTAKALFEAANR